MSPGCATRVTCADGTRAFVKAVGGELNPDTPGLFRREVAVLGHLGEHELWARLLASYDDGAWVALLIEDVEGRHPDFTDEAELEAVLGGTDRLSAVLRERDGAGVGGPRRRLPRLPQVGRLARRARRLRGRDARAVVAPPGPVRLGGRAARACRPADAPRRPLGHPGRQPAAPTDGRGGLRRLGHVRSRSGVGRSAARPPGAGGRLRGSTRRSRSPRRSPRRATTRSRPSSPASPRTWRCARCVAADVNLPTLNDFRIRESRRMLDGVARRIGR